MTAVEEDIFVTDTPTALAEPGEQEPTPPRRAQAMIVFENVSKTVRPTRGRPRVGVVRDREGRVRLPGRPVGLRQVDDDPPAAQGARADDRPHHHRRPRPGRLPHRRVPQLRRNIGCVFQDFKLLSDRTTSENVAYALKVQGEPQRAIRRKVPEVLGLVGLTHKGNSYPDELSGGEQQRVSIARAVNHPPLLVCDEPPGTSTPTRPSGSCSSSTGSTARARRS